MPFNRRYLPRVQGNIPAKVILSGGLQLDVVVKDLSSQSIQLQCTSAAQFMLFPPGASGSSGQPIRVGLYMLLPNTYPADGEGLIVKAVCEVTVCRRLSALNYVIIMSFRNVDPLSVQNLTNYININLKQTVSRVAS